MIIITPLMRTIITGFISGFKAAEKAKYGIRNKRVYSIRDYKEKRPKLTIQGIRSSYSSGEENTSVEQRY